MTKAPHQPVQGNEIPGLIYEINEIFTPSSPVGIADLFAGRTKQITQLISAIAEPGRHAILYGERGVGKTSIAHVIKFWIPSKNRQLLFHRKPCDPSDNFSSIWKKIFRDIHFEIGHGDDLKTYSVDEIYKGDISPYDVVRELKNFKPNDVPVFVIDEFNEVTDAETSILMANTIKALSDEAVNATIIIVGVADNVTQLFEDHASIDRCCEEVPMPRMSTTELGQIIDTRLKQLGMTIDADGRMKIIVLSRGLPMYVHSLGKLSATRAIYQSKKHISEEYVDKSIEEMLSSSQQSLRTKYEKSVYSNQPGNLFREVLLACALTKSDDNGFFVPAAVREPLSKIMGKDIQIAQYQNHLNSFSGDDRGKILFRSGAERQYRFRFKDPAMQPYVLMKGISDGFISNNLNTILSFPQQPDLFSNAK
ncbi:MAG: orc1/cdc6 family replication initiation protein [Micavibrio aeruginosavorus]|uniref:Orc1/cdc6 family replication initiation protein n=1 Tax=Micavibrio aeruginosavorus TaxID=349221 RepID=A0A7T5R200_9BACT|nr:MAG: orc1/cdc6 family replication initiation protein [Micavibrio aeruginosavorus]